MRYLIDDAATDEATALALYRKVLRWAAARAERFVLSLQRRIYDEAATVARFSRLGQVAPASNGLTPGNPAESSDTVRITGTPGEELISALTDQAAPPRATAGDLSPVEDILLFKGERALYSVSDYGRTQMLDLTDDELENLRETIRQAGFDPAVVVIAPPFVTGER